MGSGSKASVNVVSRYLAEIRDIPVLSREEEQFLFRRLQEGEGEVLDRVVRSNLSFVVKVASEYRQLGMPFEDLLNEGNLGLIEAAQRFDPEKGTKFITYAIWWIRKTIIQALSEKTSVIRVPYYQSKRLRDVREAQTRLRRELGREPTDEEVSHHLRIRPSTLRNVRELAVEESSLDRPLGPDTEKTVADLVRDLTRTPEERIIRSETLAEVAAAFRRLPEQQRRVLELRLGLTGEKPKTLQAVGERLGLSRERIRQIEHKARSRLILLLDLELRDDSRKLPRRLRPDPRERNAS